MTQEEFNNIIEKIKNNLNWYKYTNFNNNRYYLFLANGDSLNIHFASNNIAHLLGVRIDYLRQSNLFRKDANSFECLEKFIDESYSFSKLVNSGKLSYDKMFSPYIIEKLDCFQDNLKIKTDNLNFILKYDSERCYNTGEEIDICDYYISRRKNNKYYVLGLKKNDRNNYYPVTSRLYDDYDDYDKFIKNIARKQEFTYPVIFNINNSENDYSKKIVHNIEEKKIFLDKIGKMAEKYDAVFFVSKDYTHNLNNLSASKINHTKMIETLKIIKTSIEQKNVLDNDYVLQIWDDSPIPDELKSLINVVNDNVVMMDIDTPAVESYSSIVDEREKYKNELKELKQKLEEEQLKNKKLEDENTRISKENDNYMSDLNVLTEAFEKVKFRK